MTGVQINGYKRIRYAVDSIISCFAVGERSQRFSAGTTRGLNYPQELLGT